MGAALFYSGIMKRVSAPQELQHHGVEVCGVFNMDPMAGIGDGLDVSLREITPDDIMMLWLDVG